MLALVAITSAIMNEDDRKMLEGLPESDRPDGIIDWEHYISGKYRQDAQNTVKKYLTAIDEQQAKTKEALRQANLSLERYDKLLEKCTRNADLSALFAALLILALAAAMIIKHW